MAEFADVCNKLRFLRLPDQSVLEIELRLLVDKRDTRVINGAEQLLNPLETTKYAKSLIAKYTDADISVSQTATVIYSDDVQRQTTYKNGEKQNKLTIFRRKKPLINPVFLTNDTAVGYKFSASVEEQVSNYAENKDINFVRFKLRYSAQISDIWRLDITLIKKLDQSDNDEKMNKYRNKFLMAKITPDKFVEQVPWDDADKIEFELEYTGMLSKFNITSLRIADNFSTVTNVSDGEDRKYRNLLHKIAKMMGHRDSDAFRNKFGIKQLGNQSIELTKNIFVRELLPSISNYFATNKVDGTRCLVYLSPVQSAILTDTIEIIEESELDDVGGAYVVDCEKYITEKGNDEYYIFDVIHAGESQMLKPFEERLMLFESVSNLWTRFRLKPFVPLTNKFYSEITSMDQKEYKTDGYIFTPKRGNYRDMICYKYKPPSHRTVDFLIKKAPKALISDTKDANLHVLFCGMSPAAYKTLGFRLIDGYNEVFPNINTHNLTQYFPVQFQPSNGDAYFYRPPSGSKLEIDGEIGEFLFDKEWKLIRIREDRRSDLENQTYFGNAFKIAEQMWFAYQNPLNLSDFKSGKLDGYFASVDNVLQKNSRNFNSFVKNTLLEQFKKTEFTIDMCSGNGQDLFRYRDFNYKEVLMTEIDGNAIEELISRKNEKIDKFSNASTRFMVSQINFLDPAQLNISNITTAHHILEESADLIICNFALHYFMESKSTATNVVKFVSKMLKKNGKFMFTAFDAAAVTKLLNEHKGDFTVKVGKDIKFAIRGDTKKTNHVLPFGQKISVVLPFSGQKYYEEYLVNFNSLDDIMRVNGLARLDNNTFDVFFKKYNGQLDADDKNYVSLYRYAVFQKQ